MLKEYAFMDFIFQYSVYFVSVLFLVSVLIIITLKRKINQLTKKLDDTIRKLEDINSKHELRGHFVDELFRVMPDGVIVIKGDSFYSLNYGAIRMLGLTPDESVKNFLQGKNIDDLIVNNGQDFFLKISNGSTIPILLNKTEANIGDEVFIIFTFKEATDIVATQENLKKQKQSLEVVLRTLSHDIRNSIYIASFTLLTSISTFDIDSVKEVRRMLNNLYGMVDSILEIARYNEGGLVIKKECTSISEIVNSVIRGFSLSAGRIKISFSFEDAYYTMTDPKKLTGILNNIIGNAVKFAKSKVEVRVCLIEKHGKEYLLFSIKDDGMGISKEDTKKLFQPFSQVGSNVSNLGDTGSGLGLSITKIYSQILGGEIWLNPEVITGAEFQFHIPYEKSNPCIQEEVEVRVLDSKVTAIVADDLPLNRKIIEKILSSIGIKVIHASSGREVLDMVAGIDYNNPDSIINIVFMDIEMPGMSGLEAAEKIRKFNKNIPIVAITAHDEIKDDPGFSGIIRKGSDNMKNSILRIIYELFK